jgi:cytochrome d ubiquinol oxidase subunit I
MDVVLLSRIQFALTVMFHYLFPPLTIGMGIVLVYLDWKWVSTKQPLYESAAKFWTRLFALNFAVGVASGIVMEFQFGTNWATYSRFVGDVFGSALAAEGIFAFFLESGFLAVLVFGWDRVTPRMHFFSTCMVALGSMFSAVWIVVANSWQQTPAGHHVVPMLRDGKPWVVDGTTMMRAEIVDFWAMVLNPSTLHRLSHVLIGCFVMGAFFIMSISAWYLLKGRHLEFAKHSFQGALVLAAIASLAALFSGHLQAKAVYRNQPAKMAAYEGHFETGRGDLSLFGIPDAEAETMRFDVALPGMLGFLLFEDTQREVVGLDKFRKEDRPPVLVPYATYRLMIGLGTLFIVLTLYASLQLWRKKLFEQRWVLWIFVFAVLGSVAANQAGWIAAEVGRQPWIVVPPIEWNGDELVVGPGGVVEYDETQGLRTSDAVSPAVSSGQVLGSLVLFSLVYLLLAAVWVFVLDSKIRKGPEPPEELEKRRREKRKFLEAAADRVGAGGAMTGRGDDREEGVRP